MPPSRLAVLCAALGGVAMPATLAAGQVAVEVTPVVGLYLPLADMIDQYDQSSGIGLRTTQRVAFTVGGRVGIWLGPRLALEASGTYAASEVHVEVTPIGSGTEQGSVTTLSLRAVYRLGAPGRRGPRWYLLGGVAVLDRRGDYWDNITAAGIATKGLTDASAVLGGGIALAVGGPWALRIEVEDHAYVAEFTFDDGVAPPEATERRLQQDLVLSVEMSLRLGGR